MASHTPLPDRSRRVAFAGPTSRYGAAMAPGTRLPKILVLRDGRTVRTLAGARALIFELPKNVREKPHWKQAAEFSTATHVNRAYIAKFSALFKAALEAEGLI